MTGLDPREDEPPDALEAALDRYARAFPKAGLPFLRGAAGPEARRIAVGVAVRPQHPRVAVRPADRAGLEPLGATGPLGCLAAPRVPRPPPSEAAMRAELPHRPSPDVSAAHRISVS